MINMPAPSLLQQSPSARCALAKPCPCKPSLALHNRLHGRGRAGDSRGNGHRVMTRAVESPDTDSQSSSPAERQNQLYNYRISVEEDDEPTSCSPSFVSVNNTAHEKWTILDVDVADYPGLIRTISWVLNGMEMRVQNATLQTKDGWAHDVFWLSTWGGKKLTDKQAALAAERVQDFVVFCEPKKCTPTEWGLKNLHISNADHPDWTVLVIEGEPKRQGFVLELASVLGGTGTQVQEAYIQSEPIENKEPAPEGSPPQPVAVAPPDYDFSKGRYFKFFLSDEAGHKLDSSRIGAILFTYDVFTDSRHMPLVAPNMDSYLRRQEQEGCA